MRAHARALRLMCVFVFNWCCGEYLATSTKACLLELRAHKSSKVTWMRSFNYRLCGVGDCCKRNLFFFENVLYVP